MNSENTNEIAAALAKAQGQMTNAKYNKINPHFKNKYADLGAVIDAIKKPLADNGIAYTQQTNFPHPNDGGSTFVLTTTLLHASGQWIASEYPLPYAPDKPQVMGSALTYARRYELATICGIAAEEDTDAEGVAEAVGARKPPKPAPDLLVSDENKVVGTITPPGGLKDMKPPLHDPQTGEVPQNDGDFGAESPTPDIPVEDMAREAAQRGREVMKQFYRSKSKADKAKIDLIRPELDDMVDAAEAAAEGEGS